MWTIQERADRFYIIKDGRYCIGSVDEKQDADLIAKAVNSYEDNKKRIERMGNAIKDLIYSTTIQEVKTSAKKDGYFTGKFIVYGHLLNALKKALEEK